MKFKIKSLEDTSNENSLLKLSHGQIKTNVLSLKNQIVELVLQA